MVARNIDTHGRNASTLNETTGNLPEMKYNVHVHAPSSHLISEITAFDSYILLFFLDSR